ncbi:hypothetical protein MCOR27_003339 [Pyricularia oryzae]|uniref:L-ornithine N(5)-monooxygenase n=2 Tax=Pyricularia TaxID=48558 RepID=A0ABQ8N460_PYRGI|nr:hypothetical protein MCOR01_010464 [Pyricularia oryzae]KAI6290635.1 hypothetical protein MCOR33_011164 [Pyricularia grisea]KAH9438551.1 hypothetical protein MCOR02_002169 [Pyricularia oryzae]KAI6261061.1 hypothetical protein MCOR19_002718 [Pyricularia oryzae]KAI6281404.1 hypothetical protein MCOR26_003253 [Pyricularia oryzae]
MATLESDNNAILDILIVGAGPAGLAVASRLCERSPSALFTDEEHQRYHWIKKHGHRMSLKCRKGGAVIPSSGGSCCSDAGGDAPPKCRLRYKTLVLDATGDSWMNRWNKLFATFQISHLRSPMFWHVDPAERDALLAWAHELGRQDDLVELRGCVGKEISKHLRKSRISKHSKHHSVVEIDERERKDYYTPPQAVFADHNKSIANRYGIQDGLIRQGRVQDIKYAKFPNVSRTEDLFQVKSEDGTTHYARSVVLAVGPANAPNIPAGIEGLSPAPGQWEQPPRTSHSMRITHGQIPDPAVQKIVDSGRTTNVLVIGGGLTSAQISDVNIRKGVTKVWHMMRGTAKIKAFDVDLAWMGKYRNVEHAYFWGAESDEERLEQIRKARGGGSIPSLYWKKVKAHMASGKLELRQKTRLTSASFDEASQKWTVKTEPPIDEAVLPKFDFIYFATGIEANVETLPYMQTLLESHPIETQGGLPCLTEDLMWRDDVPLFVAGRLASLRLGPAGPNLGGARTGAERISWALDEFLEERLASEESEGFEPEIFDEEQVAFVTGRNNRYRALSIEGEEEW